MSAEQRNHAEIVLTAAQLDVWLFFYVFERSKISTPEYNIYITCIYMELLPYSNILNSENMYLGYENFNTKTFLQPQNRD